VAEKPAGRALREGGAAASRDPEQIIRRAFQALPAACVKGGKIAEEKHRFQFFLAVFTTL